ncbi:MAG: serine/threonine-protein kinase [Gammaproteobacteria bacterium]
MSNKRKRRSLSSGERIGKYQLDKIIHQGKYRTIYKAHDPFLDRDVAIKISQYPDNQDGEENSQQLRNSFFLETRAVGKLQHPNIVSVYDAGVGDRQTFIVMEYIDARSLASIMNAKEEISVSKAIDIIFKCCKALEYAHSKNVVHRDIKPANILITEDGNVKIVDFGIAKVRNEIDTFSSGLFGSPLYMAPEQIEEQEVGPSTDLYALGVVLYELLTGAKTFEADNVHTHMYKILNEKPRTLASYGVEHAEKIQPVIDQALEKKSEQRYPAAADFAAAIRSVDIALRYEEAEIIKRVNTDQAGMLGFFKDFSQKQLSEFVDLATWLRITNEETILSAGEIDQTFYVIVGGKAIVYKSNEPVKTLAEGDCFGELGLLRNENSSTSVMANTDMLLMKLTTTDLDKMSTELQAQFYKAVAHSMVKRLADNKIAADKAA